MICILTEQNDWVPDAVTLLESQGETVNVTYCNCPEDEDESHDSKLAFVQECSVDMNHWSDVIYPNSESFGGLIAMAGDFYTTEQFDAIKNQVIELAEGGAE